MQLQLEVKDHSVKVTSLIGDTAPFVGEHICMIEEIKQFVKKHIHPSDTDIFDEITSQVIKGFPKIKTLRFRKTNGTIKIARVTCQKIRNESTHAITVDLKFEDPHKLVNEIQDSTVIENFSAMMNTTNDYIFFKDRNHVFTGASQTLCHVTNRENWQDLIGQTDYDLFPKEYADEYYALEKRVFNGEIEVAQDIQEFIDNDGNKGWVDNRKYPMKNEKGEITGLFGIARDITKIVNAEALAEAQSKYKTLLEVSTDSIHVLDEKGNVLLFSKSFADSLGYTHEEVMRLNVVDWDAQLPKDELPGITKNLFDKTANFQTKHKRKDGSTFDVEVHAKGIVINGRRVLYASSRDITDRVQAEENSRRERMKFQTLFENSPDAYLIMELSASRIIDCNSSAALMLKGTKEDLLGATPDQLSPEFQPNGERSEDLIQGNTDQVLENGNYRFEWIHRRLDGELFPCDVNTSLIDYQGSQALLVGWRDNTAIKKREEETKRQAQLAQHNAKLASVGELAAGVGHEINNPLAIIKGYLDAIKYKQEMSDQPDEKLIQIIGKMDIATQRINKIVKGLRTFARTDSDETTEFDPLEALEESHDLLNDIYSREGYKLILDSKRTQNSSIIVGSRGRFQQIIMNLVSNAKDALADCRDKRIKIALGEVNETFEIVVSDKGQGMSEEVQSKIFNLFFTTKGVNQGTGIGLSLVHNYVKEMGGSISVNSKKGEGTEFTLRFPMSEPTKVTELPTLEKAENPHRGKSILLVEDEIEIREILTELLEGLGYTVATAENGEVAIKTLKASKKCFDMVMTDMQMPVMNGLSLLKQIKQLPELNETKVIFFTGGINLDLDSPTSELNGLYDSYFFKPFSSEQVAKAIEDCFNKEHGRKVA